MVRSKEEINQKARDRYHNDQAYREKILRRSNKYYHTHKEQWKVAQEKRIAKRHSILEDAGLITDCVICGFPKEKKAAIDFHHTNPSTKERHISDFRGISPEEYVEEARKCICLCANCHRLYHTGDRETVQKYNEAIKRIKEGNNGNS